MKNNLILYIILFFSYLSYGQKTKLTQEEFSKIYNKDWCECLTKEAKQKPSETIVSELAVSCSIKTLMPYTQDKGFYNQIKQLIESKNYNSNLSDYEKERLFGREVGNTLMINAINNCDIYRESIKKFKQFYIEKARKDATGKDKKETDALIASMQQTLYEINPSETNDNQKVKISEYFLILGILYEFSNKKDLAIKQYEKALEFSPQNYVAIGFKKILESE